MDGVDERVLENAWYYSALGYAADVAQELNEYADLPWLRQRMQSIEEHFHGLFWKGDGYRSAEKCDDRANALAVLTGLAMKQTYPAIAQVLREVRQATPYMEAFILQTLFEMGEDTLAMERMMERYEPLIDNENSTLWEDFTVLGTRNHAWSGAPLALAFRYLAGIEPVGDGWRVQPRTGLLHRFTARVAHLRGSDHRAGGRGAGTNYDAPGIKSMSSHQCL